MSDFPFLFLLIVLPLLGAIVVAIIGRDETGQDIGGTISPFDDVAVLRETWGE